MHELYELKNKITEELKSYAKKGDLTASSLAMIDTLAHALKNIDKVIERCEEDEEMYSSANMPIPVHEGGYMRGSYDGMSNTYSRRMSREGSYARGRGARRDAMGRYSRDGYSGDDEMYAELEDLMRNAPDEGTRQKIQSIMQKM